MTAVRHASVLSQIESVRETMESYAKGKIANLTQIEPCGKFRVLGALLTAWNEASHEQNKVRLINCLS